MLRTAVELFPEDIVLVQHDGFTSKRAIDAKRIEDAIEQHWGFRMVLEEEHLMLPGRDEFTSWSYDATDLSAVTSQVRYL